MKTRRSKNNAMWSSIPPVISGFYWLCWRRGCGYDLYEGFIDVSKQTYTSASALRRHTTLYYWSIASLDELPVKWWYGPAKATQYEMEQVTPDKL